MSFLSTNTQPNFYSQNRFWKCFFHIFWSLSVLLSVKCYYPLGLQVIAVIRCASVCWPDTFYRLGPLWVKVKMGYSSSSSSEVQYLLEGNLVVWEDECGPVVPPPIPPSSLSLSEGLLRFLCGLSRFVPSWSWLWWFKTRYVYVCICLWPLAHFAVPLSSTYRCSRPSVVACSPGCLWWRGGSTLTGRCVGATPVSRCVRTPPPGGHGSAPYLPEPGSWHCAALLVKSHRLGGREGRRDKNGFE
jgi:hypothetical protein